jgi:hypothetical protein
MGWAHEWELRDALAALAKTLATLGVAPAAASAVAG